MNKAHQPNISLSDQGSGELGKSVYIVNSMNVDSFVN